MARRCPGATVFHNNPLVAIFIVNRAVVAFTQDIVFIAITISWEERNSDRPHQLP